MVSIVIPCYNEERNLKNLIKKFDKIDKKKYSFEVILVNNGSHDNSAQVMNDLEEKYSFVKVSTVIKNQGYGYGILTGLAVASGEYLGWMHADLQFEPNEICKAMDYLKKENYPNKIFIKGRRKNRPFIDKIFTCGMSIYESILLKKKMWDINAQPIIFSRNLYDSWENPPYDFSLDLYAYYTALMQGFPVFRFSVIQHVRREGTSTWNDGMSARIKLIQRVICYSKELKMEAGKARV